MFRIYYYPARVECSCLLLKLFASANPLSNSSTLQKSQSAMPTQKKVIVIGAGAAGIAAATRLIENGIKDVLIIEAEDRIGGRIYTLDIPGDDGVLEIGAQWIHGEKNNVVFELASKKKLIGRFDQVFENMLFVQSSSQVIDPEVHNKMTKLFYSIKTNPDENVLEYKTSGNYYLTKINESLQHGNYSISEDLKSQFIEWFHQQINSVDASDTWFQSSASTMIEYWECEGFPSIAWTPNGYRQLFTALSEKADSILGKNFLEHYIKKNTEVVKITPDGKGVRIKCDNNEEYIADHVIVTVSLGVLKANYKKLFPENLLPDKQQKAIQHLLFGNVAKLYLKFPHRWWPENITDISLLWNETDKSDYERRGLKWVTDVFAFMVSYNHNSTLCGWISGQSARDMEAIDENFVKNELMQVLRKFLGNKYTIPEPDWFYRSTWKSNSHFNGTYSLRGPITDSMNVSAADLSVPVVNKDNVPVILFAGEATHPHYYSTVHGAVETGWREADRIISLKKAVN